MNKICNLTKRLAYKAYLLGIVLLLTIFDGCGSTPAIIEREIKVPFETTIHDTISLRDTIINQDTLWSGQVIDSLNNVIGWLKVFYKNKIAELKLKKADTVKTIIADTLYKDKTKVVQIISGLLPWWGEGLLILFGIMLLVIQNKKISIIKWIKEII